MNLKILLIISLALFFTACSVVKYYDLGEEQQYGFNVDEGESDKVANPRENLTRIYVYRTNSIIGFTVKYGVAYSSGEFDKETIEQSPQLFYMVQGQYSYKDIEVEEGEVLNFFTETQADTLLTFYPRPNQIYCLETAINPGWLVRRAFMQLVDKQRCLEQMEDKIFQNQ